MYHVYEKKKKKVLVKSWACGCGQGLKHRMSVIVYDA